MESQLELKANKGSVATALHKKANKLDMDKAAKDIEEKFTKAADEMRIKCLEIEGWSEKINKFHSEIKGRM